MYENTALVLGLIKLHVVSYRSNSTVAAVDNLLIISSVLLLKLYMATVTAIETIVCSACLNLGITKVVLHSVSLCVCVWLCVCLCVCWVWK